MSTKQKEAYVQPALAKHELLRDITAGSSSPSHSEKCSLVESWFGFRPSQCQ